MEWAEPGGWLRSVDPAGGPAAAISRLMDLAANSDASPQVRAEAEFGLRRIRFIAATSTTAHAISARYDIERFLNRPDGPYRRTDPLPTPAGEPIGGRIRGGGGK